MKKYFFLLAALSLSILSGFSQSIAINDDGSLANPHAIVDIKSSKKGVLIPRMNTAARQAIPNTKGLLVYDTDDNLFWYNDGTGWQSFFTADMFKKNGEAWLIKGNNSTKIGVNFIGTRDNVPLDFRVNNQPAGRIDPVRGSTYWGYLAENIDSTGENTIEGLNGEGITAIGYKALYSNLTGGNTAVGALALSSNLFGKENAALGYRALSGNTNGIDNAAVGWGTLGQNTMGSFNTASGYLSLWQNSTGSTNTAYGSQSLSSNTTGSDNTGVGLYALSSNITGNQLTALGTRADVSVDGLNNATALGADATVDASNKVRIGNSRITVIEGQVPFTNPSDGRFKFNIQENVKGLDFILKLRPVTYQYDVKKQADFTRGVIKPDQLNTYITSAANDEATQMIRTGFIAQEVEQVAKTSGFNFDGVKAPKTEKEYYSLSYSSFVVPLVKAVQEQQVIIQAQNLRISNLEQEIAEIKKLVQTSH